MLKNFLKKNIYIWILILLTIPTFFKIIRPGFFPMQDDLQAFRIQQMDKCIQDLQIPCRWIPDAGYQYGYPQFLYYPPSTYYLGEVFHLLGFQFIDAVKLLFVSGFVLSALAMFIFLNSFLGKFSSLIGALLYTYIPYKAVEVYVRGAMSEFWSLVFFPLIFWSLYKLIKTSKIKYLAFLAISLGLLLITHNLMSMIFLPVAGIWALTWIVIEKKWSVLPKVFLSGLLGLGLAAFFTVPVLVERPYAHLETLLGGYFDYRQHFVDLNQLFISNHWGYGSSYLGPNDDLSLSTGQVQWVVAFFGVILSILKYKENKKLANVNFILFFSGLLVLFLMHQKSSFIWDKLPFFAYLQFPWRFLAVSIFLLSTMSAITIYYLEKIKLAFLKKFNLGQILGIGAVVVAFVLYGSFFAPQKWLNITDQDKFSGISWQKQLTISIFDYLPIYAKLPPIHQAPDFPEIMSGQAQFLSYKKGSDYQIGKLVVSQPANLRLPLFDFPGMKVTVDNDLVVHNHSDCRNEEFCLGLINFNVSTGTHIIKAELTNTPVRTIGDLLTILSLIIIIKLFIYSKRYESNFS
ncbi:hypothetical protein HY025_00105 [Candidatus Daviesbacteria bacterium]|nr:hypothetical protein [Candidatus Daviesbacteria bacterium]